MLTEDEMIAIGVKNLARMVDDDLYRSGTEGQLQAHPEGSTLNAQLSSPRLASRQRGALFMNRTQYATWMQRTFSLAWPM